MEEQKAILNRFNRHLPTVFCLFLFPKTQTIISKGSWEQQKLTEEWMSWNYMTYCTLTEELMHLSHDIHIKLPGSWHSKALSEQTLLHGNFYYHWLPEPISAYTTWAASKTNTNTKSIRKVNGRIGERMQHFFPVAWWYM